MRTFGQCNEGGRRAARRVSADVTARVKTLTSAYSAIVDDLSCTGIRLRGAGLPRCGDEVELQLGPLSAFGTAIWSAADRCGVAFDIPLTTFDVVLVKRTTGLDSASKLTGDERIALEQWATGGSR